MNPPMIREATFCAGSMVSGAPSPSRLVLRTNGWPQDELHDN